MVYFIQFILSLFFPNRLTFVVNVLMDVGFKVGVRNFKFVIIKDNADLASKSANSFPRILMWLGSQQNVISFKFLKEFAELMGSYGVNL